MLQLLYSKSAHFNTPGKSRGGATRKEQGLPLGRERPAPSAAARDDGYAAERAEHDVYDTPSYSTRYIVVGMLELLEIEA